MALLTNPIQQGDTSSPARILMAIQQQDQQRDMQQQKIQQEAGLAMASQIRVDEAFKRKEERQAEQDALEVQRYGPEFALKKQQVDAASNAANTLARQRDLDNTPVANPFSNNPQKAGLPLPQSRLNAFDEIVVDGQPLGTN